MAADESVSFDRAAQYYDRTRGLTAEGVRKTTELLVRELRGRGRVLEVGVGTGQLAIPLHAAGIQVVGLDLARPMMDKLVEKAGGSSPFPLVQADATRIPIRHHVFGGAYLRWVLHLIPEWQDALAEIVRVVRPGGVLLTSIGGYGSPRSEIQARFAQLTGVSTEPPGLTWAGYDELNDAATALGLIRRDLPPISEVERDSLKVFIDGIADNVFSWTWKVEDPALFARAADEVRRWAEERFGRLDQISPEAHGMVWEAYDLPS